MSRDVLFCVCRDGRCYLVFLIKSLMERKVYTSISVVYLDRGSQEGMYNAKNLKFYVRLKGLF
jgi:hypothetical protein